MLLLGMVYVNVGLPTPLKEYEVLSIIQLNRKEEKIYLSAKTVHTQFNVQPPLVLRQVTVYRQEKKHGLIVCTLSITFGNVFSVS